jgi:hypothetical protein
MGQRVFKPARNAGGNVPEMRRCLVDSAQTFKKGAVVLTAADGELEEGGANPASILGIALAAVGSGLGYGMANESQITVFTGRVNEITVAIANGNTIFSGALRNGATEETVAQALIGDTYGITEDADGIWYVDVTKNAANQRVQIVDVDTDLNMVLFKFLTANLQQPQG